MGTPGRGGLEFVLVGISMASTRFQPVNQMGTPTTAWPFTKAALMGLLVPLCTGLQDKA